MDRRLQLQTLLEYVVGSAVKVYFQPPSNLKMTYPCVVYQRDTSRTQFAGNIPYRRTKRYQVTVIDSNPDSLLPDKVAELPTAVHRSTFAAGNLNHDVFNLFF